MANCKIVIFIGPPDMKCNTDAPIGMVVAQEVVIESSADSLAQFGIQISAVAINEYLALLQYQAGLKSPQQS